MKYIVQRVANDSRNSKQTSSGASDKLKCKTSECWVSMVRSLSVADSPVHQCGRKDKINLQFQAGTDFQVE
jgi:hypothetical protein